MLASNTPSLRSVAKDDRYVYVYQNNPAHINLFSKKSDNNLIGKMLIYCTGDCNSKIELTDEKNTHICMSFSVVLFYLSSALIFVIKIY